MKYNELYERRLRMEFNNNPQPVIVLENPSVRELIDFFEHSKEKDIRGLIHENNVYWWDSFYGWHGHIAELVDSNYPEYNLANRLQITNTDDGRILDFDTDDSYRIMNHPKIHPLLVSDLVLFYSHNMGKVNWSEYQENLKHIKEDKKTLKLPDIEIGDEVRVGRFKNRKATVTGFDKDDHNQPVLKTNKGPQKLFKPRISKLEEK